MVSIRYGSPGRSPSDMAEPRVTRVTRRSASTGAWEMEHWQRACGPHERRPADEPGPRWGAEVGARVRTVPVLPGISAGREVSIHPPFISLGTLQAVTEADPAAGGLGAQTRQFADTGPHTGEVAAEMRAKLNASRAERSRPRRRHADPNRCQRGCSGRTGELQIRCQDQATRLRARSSPGRCCPLGRGAERDGGEADAYRGKRTLGLSGQVPSRVDAATVGRRAGWFRPRVRSPRLVLALVLRR